MKLTTLLMLGMATMAVPLWPVLAQEPDEAPAVEAGPAKTFPWYGSLKKTEVNVRSGPGNQYPILWVYQRAGYPVQVLARYDNYFKLRDVEGEEGWVYVGMVSKRLTGLVAGKAPINLYRRAETSAQVVARLAPGLVVELEECETAAEGGLCKVNAGGTRGWVVKGGLEMVE